MPRHGIGAKSVRYPTAGRECSQLAAPAPGKRYQAWTLDDPAGLGLAYVRLIRDDIERRVLNLLAELRVPASQPDPVG